MPEKNIGNEQPFFNRKESGNRNSRIGLLLTLADLGSPRQLELEFNYAMAHGLIENDFDLESYGRLRNTQDWHGGGYISATGKHLGDPLINYALNTMVAEPSYIELLGAGEIQRLRRLPNPKILLAGAAGEPSINGVLKLAEKINPQSSVDVVDLHAPKFSAPTNMALSLNQGDVLDMAGRENSYDLIMTNNILHELQGSGDLKADLQKLLDQSALALKTRGSLMLYETNAGFSPKFIGQNMADLLQLVHTHKHLKPAGRLERALVFHFPKENSSSTIDENGVGHYENACLREVAVGVLCERLEKVD